jgi:cytoskeletal protein CcmA (bactofilin family)
MSMMQIERIAKESPMFKKQSDAPTASSFRIEASAGEPRTASKGVSVLGPTLTFRGGELSSDEDLIIEGTVEGKIAHQNHHLTIGKNGRVKANVRARLITVYGTVEGDLHGDEGVQITATARVIGNVISPRVSLESGAKFEGSITTKEEPRGAARATPPDPADAILDARGRATQAAAGTAGYTKPGSSGTGAR